MTKQQSENITVLSIISLIAVILLHSFTPNENRCDFAYYIELYINTFANYAVPSFFVISGYLFYLKLEETNVINSLRKKINKRFHSLFVPYIIWCTIFIIFVGIIGFFMTLNNDYLYHLRKREILDFLIYIYWEPAAFHLWYVRDLMLISLLSPLIYIIIKNSHTIILVMIFVFLICLKFLSFISWGLAWFGLGAYFSIKDSYPFVKIGKNVSLLSLFIYIFIVGFFITYHISLSSDKWYAGLIILLGVIGMWGFVNTLRKSIKDKIIGYGISSFFIYCFHIPFLNIIKKALSPIGYYNTILDLICFFVATIATIIIGHYLSKLISNYFPKTYNLLTGGR